MSGEAHQLLAADLHGSSFADETIGSLRPGRLAIRSSTTVPAGGPAYNAPT
jgi:hypothetical protein